MSEFDRDLLTIKQAADFLQMSQQTVRKYIREGRLGAHKVGGMRRVLIPRQNVLGLLEPARGEYAE